MLTLEEILSDVGKLSEFSHLDEVTQFSRGVNGATPLHWMATLGDSRGIELLLQAGTEIDATDNNGDTPMHEAVVCRQLTAIRTLVGAGAALDLRNSEGKTPLELAKDVGFNPTIAFLEHSSVQPPNVQ